MKINQGDQVSDMDNHVPTWTSFVDWENYSPVVITNDIFYAMIGEIESLRGDLIMNKMAYAVSSTTDVDGETSTILIIYHYDHQYYCSMLISPKWKNVI